MNPEYPFQPQQQPAQPQAPAPTPAPMTGGFAPVPQQPYPQQPFQPQAQAPVAGPPPRANPSKKWTILTFVFIFTTLAAAGAGGWALFNYFDQKDNVDNKVSTAVALAVKGQKETDQKAFDIAEKEPNRDFTGPDDYGRVAFKYPKTWSVYEAKDAGSGGTYEAYFSPGVIPPVAADQRYALRLTIEDVTYEKAISNYELLVKKGDLKSSSVTVGEQNGTRLEGNFTKDIRGTAVVLKIRDKTVTLRTDADTFSTDFNALIATVTFNK